MADTPRRILVVNGKGGCGKTTVATNLAAMMARRSVMSAEGSQSPQKVVLIDHDPQASSSFWAEQRGPDLPAIHVIQAHQKADFLFGTKIKIPFIQIPNLWKNTLLRISASFNNLSQLKISRYKFILSRRPNQPMPSGIGLKSL